MKIKPVVYSVKPKYPDKYEIELNKALLYYRPKRWLKEPLIGMALAALMAAGLSGSAGCRFGALGGKPAPPDYNHLSDADALEIIADELSMAGYEFIINDDEADLESGDEPEPTPKFKFDGQIIDGDKKIDTEYVSKQDCADKKYPDLNYSSYCYPQNIAEQLKENHENAAIFYDPYSEIPEEYLREQVRDFIEWLTSVGGEI